MKEYVQTRWGQIHVRREGSGTRGIVLLHESPVSSIVYEHVLPLLAKEWCAVALDTPGYGGSDGPPDIVEIPDYAATLLEGVDALGLQEFAVVGSHTGASLAVQLAVQARERVTHAILSGIPIVSDEERLGWLASYAPEVAVESDGSHLLWAWERYERTWREPPELVHLAATTLLSNVYEYHLGYQAAFRYDPEPDLLSLTCPILFLTAEGDFLLESDHRAVETLPNAQLEIVENVVGQLPLRVPERFAARILGFLSEN